MTLWLLILLLACGAAVVVARPLLRAPGVAEAGISAVSILKTQLVELEAQAQAGAVTQAEAARLKLEIERRILAEARSAEAPSRPLSARTRAGLAFALTVTAAGAVLGLYVLLGRPDVPSAPRPAAEWSLSADEIVRLEAQVRSRPDDPEGWRALGVNLLQAGRFQEAAAAFGRAAALNPREAAYPSALGEALTGAADGRVTDEAATAFSAALALNPGDPRARYFLALRLDQTGDHEAAMAEWVDIVNAAPPGVPWAVEMRRFVEQTARDRGIDLTGRLRPVEAPRGPTAAEMEAGEALSRTEQDQMIADMVGRLEARLAENPRDPEGWARLMQARMVLGEPDRAARAWRDGRAALAGDAASQDALDAAARRLGVPGS